MVTKIPKENGLTKQKKKKGIWWGLNSAVDMKPNDFKF